MQVSWRRNQYKKVKESQNSSIYQKENSIISQTLRQKQSKKSDVVDASSLSPNTLNSCAKTMKQAM